MTAAMIVSDVGGTNGRFAIAEIITANPLPRLSSIAVFPCNEFNSFSDMLSAYLTGLTQDIPKTARLAIAGEMEPRRGNLWHFDWDISADQLENLFGFDSVTLLNDYEALIYAIPHLKSGDLQTISTVKTGLEDAPFSAFGVGSGLGAAIGVPSGSKINVIPTEIGHISFGPGSKQEQELKQHYLESINHVSVETFLSGPGLIRIYDFLKDADQPSLTAPEITQNAKSSHDETSVNTVALFTDILAGVTGDIALAQGARAGIYIGGGIVPKIVDLIDTERFIDRFHRRGPMSAYVKKIPIHIITAKMPSLLGAAINS